MIGKSNVVDNTDTDIIAISDPDVHLQIWIGADDKLPRLIWATAADSTEKPRHMVEFSDWDLDGDIPEDSAFAPHTTESTRQIPGRSAPKQSNNELLGPNFFKR